MAATSPGDLGERAELLQQTELVGDPPTLDDLAAGDPHDADAGQADRLSGCCDAEERALVRAGDRVPVGQLVLPPPTTSSSVNRASGNAALTVARSRGKSSRDGDTSS